MEQPFGLQGVGLGLILPLWINKRTSNLHEICEISQVFACAEMENLENPKGLVAYRKGPYSWWFLRREARYACI